MPERMIAANGIEIWTEDFGDRNDPAVLLIMGASAQGIMLPEPFCQGIVDGGRYVIRYDNRDTGQSTCFGAGNAKYGLPDMARDAIGVLDAYGIDRAHVVGASMGGMIGQTVAIEHPDRIRSLTSIMSTPAGGEVAAAMEGEAKEGGLPGPTQAVIEASMKAAVNPPASQEERIEQRLEMFRVLAGSLGSYDETARRAVFELEYSRARDYESMGNHGLALTGSPDRRPALAKLSLPVLVIHGTEDPILPYEHGVATAKAISGAELLTIEKMGHDMPEVALPQIIGAILRHTE